MTGVDERYGVYRASSDIIEVSSSYRDWVDFEQWLLGLVVPSGQPTEQQLKTFISHVHEHMHRVDFQTTSFGLFMWRIDLTLTTDARYLAKWFGRPPDGVTLAEYCHEQFECLPPATDAEEGKQRRDRYLVIEELERLVRFRVHLWGGAPQSFTLAELVSEANDVLDVLRKRFDLRSTWKFTTARPDDDAAVSVPYVTSYGLDDVVSSIGARDVFERSAMLWERLSLFVYAVGGIRPVSVQERWPESVRIWFDWRLAKSLYPDLGDLNDVSNLFSQKGFALFALSGPCDPALDFEVDIPIEAALPPMRWAAARQGAVDPDYVSEPFEAAVYETLAAATLNGRHGLFADSLATQSAIQADDPLQSYNAFVLQRFHDEFWRRTQTDRGLPSQRIVPELNPLATLFDEFCLVKHTELHEHGPLDPQTAGGLLFQLYFEHIHQQMANHDVGKESLDLERLVRGMRPMGRRLCTDFVGSFPEKFRRALADAGRSAMTPDQLCALAIASYALDRHRSVESTT